MREPFFRPSRGLWYVWVEGQQVNLGRDRAQAFARYAELLRNPRLGRDSVGGLLTKYLAWCRMHKAPRTHERYKQLCDDFVDWLGALAVAELRTFHVQDWVDSKPTWNNGTKRAAMIAVKLGFNWLSKQGHIDRSPLLGLELPPAGRRERVITKEEHNSIVARYENDPFADLLELAWETGARAQELWNVEARHVDGAKWAFPAKEAKGKRRPRIVHLSTKALLITQRLMLKYPGGETAAERRRRCLDAPRGLVPLPPVEGQNRREIVLDQLAAFVCYTDDRRGRGLYARCRSDGTSRLEHARPRLCKAESEGRQLARLRMRRAQSTRQLSKCSWSCCSLKRMPPLPVPTRKWPIFRAATSE